MSPNKVLMISLKPLKTIGPSQFERVKNCQLREVWSANREIAPLLPGALEARVGSVFHRLRQISRGGQGLPGCTSAEQAWDYLIQAQEAEMQTSALERHLVPIADNLWNYGTKKALCLRSINPALPTATSSTGATVGDDARLTGPEVPVWDTVRREDAAVRGSVDLVEKTPEGYVLTDFKTGEVLDEKGLVKEEYRQQLRLYAALFEKKAKQWPVKLAVIGLDDKVFEVPFSQSDCQALLVEAQQLRQSMNHEITAGATAADLATPAPANCYYCLYRPACPAYWGAREENDEWPTDVRGQLMESPFPQRNGNCRIKLKRAEQEVTVCDLPGQPDPGSFQPGEDIAVYSAVPEFNREEQRPWANHFCAGPMTAIYTHESGNGEDR